jgi:catechol 2,3-dioxygenase-like lactoylglutathione lyase family enzyme
MKLERAVPILPARDLQETRAFYERLGFATWGFWAAEFGGYAILGREHVEMHFFLDAGLDPGKNSAGCYWRVDDADALHAEYRPLGLPSSGMPRLTNVEDKPWGTREFALVDPSGNLVRVGHPLG